METHEHAGPHTKTIQLPAPTAWPIVLAFGITLVFAGIVTSPMISLLGGVLAISAAIGWFRQVIPHEAHEEVPVSTAEEIAIFSARTSVARIEVSAQHRARLPLETYPIISGLKGGIVGGVVMIFPALLYGLIGYHSIWYPVNLLGGAGIAGWKNPTTADIAAFHAQGLIAATIIHVVACLLIGLLYGAVLPMLPRRPVLLGGIIAPLLWTGLLHSALGIIDPELNERIDWGWFILSQIAFGMVAGWIVSRDNKVPTGQSLPVAVRMGLETPGLHVEEKEDSDR
ncbi:hypothetical protein FTO74_03755 [Granulicella sp. WH15]|uniref:hypothetical protein n=1 Tax=Granulicella sp. WH15 TaxID=2602070 RepID=UPI0013675AC7|nr:hypothetical protein [Granulicella sp. WH15]QHN02583.1 hypothetical protein FTO74_03755 [Granulicella sp. WH15]